MPFLPTLFLRTSWSTSHPAPPRAVAHDRLFMGHTRALGMSPGRRHIWTSDLHCLLGSGQAGRREQVQALRVCLNDGGRQARWLDVMRGSPRFSRRGITFDTFDTRFLRHTRSRVAAVRQRIGSGARNNGHSSSEGLGGKGLILHPCRLRAQRPQSRIRDLGGGVPLPSSTRRT